jgi:hypothetical protein
VGTHLCTIDTGDETCSDIDCIGFSPGNTPADTNVVVVPPDSTTGTTPVTLTFEDVTVTGHTTLSTSQSGPSPPQGIEIPTVPPMYYELNTTAVYSGTIEICIAYDDTLMTGAEEDTLRMFHLVVDGGSPAWKDITTSLDTNADIICGETTSLSPFIIGKPISATGIGDEPPPARFALYQNIPNPFNPSTLIRYDVPSGGGHVEIRIYDVSGRLVKTLINEMQSEGRKSVIWDARNTSGEEVASGVYFYRMRAGDLITTKKMLLLR